MFRRASFAILYFHLRLSSYLSPQTTTMLRFFCLSYDTEHTSQFLTNYVLVLQLQLPFYQVTLEMLNCVCMFHFFFFILNIGLTSYEMCCFICMSFMCSVVFVVVSS